MCASEVPPPCSRQVVPGCSLSRGEESQPVACLGHRLAGTLEHSGGFGQALLRVGRSERGWRGERDGERGCVIIAGRGWRAALDKGQQVWRRLVWWRRVGGRVSHPGDPDWMEQPRARALTQHEHKDTRTTHPNFTGPGGVLKVPKTINLISRVVGMILPDVISPVFATLERQPLAQQRDLRVTRRAHGRRILRVREHEV